MTQPATERMKLRRGADRAVYEPAEIEAILDVGVVAHVGVDSGDGPIVLPMAYGVADGKLYLHGALANALLRAGSGVDVCATVTILDALVVARTPFHNSFNYRSVVIRGTANKVDDPDEKVAALKVINDHIVDTWDTARPPSESDIRRTLVLAVPLTEASAKVRSGDPIDDDEDMDGPHWSGLLPLMSTWGDPVSAADLRGETEIPTAVVELGGTNAHP
ncbi:MAG: pyridoxamine 5'-phosphate oxidase family protein [Actinomycetia bacterium]|nr:pyridoxamine 5'-phosphate oxidase family protein [Actinomycetes bacterium]MCP5028883.1 pyridoxamine 5'-phosphate oxidase family protein [Actinomycetes bacterium]